ncbi:MAG: M16 family metallopeptidase [Acutalibacteraceae bacterium]
MKKIGKGVNFAFHQTDKFENSLISFSFIAPLCEKSAEDCLALTLLSGSCSEFKNEEAMKEKLDSLSASCVQSEISKYGEEVLLTLAIETKSKKEEVIKECAALLCKCVFRPNVTPDGFLSEDVEKARNIIYEKIKEEAQDEKLYSFNKMIEEMCSKEAYSFPKFGEKERIESLNGKTVFERWLRLIVNCPVQISFIGCADPAEIENCIKPYFDQIQRKEVWPVKTDFITDAYEQNVVTQKGNSEQTIIEIGFRAGMTYDRDNLAALILTTMLFGIGNDSKLNSTLCQKEKLCSSCEARLIPEKGIISVHGVLKGQNNSEKAVKAILNELDEIRKCNFKAEELSKAKKLAQSYLSYTEENINSLLKWLLSFSLSSAYLTPKELADMIGSVSAEEIIVASCMITLDTVTIFEAKGE